MQQRINYYKVAPEAIQIMLETEKYTKTTTIDPKLRELIKIRASQINGCAFCLNMHTLEARANRETQLKLFLNSYLFIE